MAVRRGAPQIVARLDAAEAERAARALRAKGAAITVSHSAMGKLLRA